MLRWLLLTVQIARHSLVIGKMRGLEDKVPPVPLQLPQPFQPMQQMPQMMQLPLGMQMPQGMQQMSLPLQFSHMPSLGSR